LGLFFLRGRRTSAVGWLALPALGLAAASAALMAALYQPGPDPTRVYEGTDTRAAGLLIGAALAMFLAARRRPSAAASPAAAQPAVPQPAVTQAAVTQTAVTQAAMPPAAALATPAEPAPAPPAPAGRTPSAPVPARWRRAVLDVAGFAGLAGIGLMIWRTGQYSPFLYRGGLVVLSVATLGVVAAVACPGTLVGAALGWGPLRWIGARSYGIYLWHYPVIVLTTPLNAGENLARAAAQIGASVILAALSWRFIEEPVRHGAIGRAAARLRAAGWRTALSGGRTEPGRAARPARLRGLAALTGTAGLLAVAGVGLSGIIAAPAGGGQGSLSSAATLPLSSRFSSRTGAHPVFAGGDQPGHRGGTAGAGKGASSAAGTGGSAASGASAAGSAAGGSSAAGPPRTSCRAVAHLGDSTSDGLVSPDYLPNPKDRIQARYEDVGAKNVWTNIAGGRSIVEVLPGTVNGYDAARSMTRQGFSGCWVLALGTDDTADVAAGSETPLATRIGRMMSAAHGQPVMWVNVISLVSSGPYAEANMQRWNAALVRACSKYPNMRVYDWAAAAHKSWFISDGIHYTSAGYKARAELIADALARAFPQSGHSSGCVVS
ncbi:MAG TPA: acyltransferase family protein, partial [Streptosporangiaceae bacterium]